MTQVIAHRGASRLAAENTVEAFERAVAVGADGVELDVRRTADGVLVVHHDARTGDGRLIADTAFRELALPTLGEALDACAGVWVDIEIKNHEHEPDFDPLDRAAAEILASLAERGACRWLLSCFRLATLDRCRLVDPSVPTAWLTLELTADTARMLADKGHTAVNPWEPAITAEHVERCHDAGILVNAWTVNDPDRCLALIAAGVDGIITDVPDVMRGLLDGAREGETRWGS